MFLIKAQPDISYHKDVSTSINPEGKIIKQHYKFLRVEYLYLEANLLVLKCLFSVQSTRSSSK